MKGNIDYDKDDTLLYCKYFGSDVEEWFLKKVKDSGNYSVKRAFTVTEKDISNKINLENHTDNFVKIVIGSKKSEEEYYELKKSVLSLKNKCYIHKDIELQNEMFFTTYQAGRYTRYEGVLGKIDSLINENLYIGGSEEFAIPSDDFQKIIEFFPTYREKNKYIDMKISTMIQEYVTLNIDYHKDYEHYREKRETRLRIEKESPTEIEIYDNEISKYQKLLDKLKEMLKNEDAYSEEKWQKEIQKFILLLFPKYIYSVEKIPVKTDEGKKELDFIMIDSDGNVDIIEIKKSHGIKILNKGLYRNNYIPSRELSGGIMQAEKYIYHLSRTFKETESAIKKKIFNDKMEVHIINPKAIMILGRTNNFTVEEKRDFEIIKRKYHNVIDIISYDDLINRLELLLNKFISVKSEIKSNNPRI